MELPVLVKVCAWFVYLTLPLGGFQFEEQWVFSSQIFNMLRFRVCPSYLAVRVECTRHWKSDTSGFVVIDGSIAWKVLEGWENRINNYFVLDVSVRFNKTRPVRSCLKKKNKKILKCFVQNFWHAQLHQIIFKLYNWDIDRKLIVFLWKWPAQNSEI